MLHATLPLGVRLDQAFGWMAGLAQSLPVEQRESVMVLLRKLLSQLGETEITVNVPIDHILCQTCDELRTKGKHEEVQLVEELVQAMKGQTVRVITGGFNLNAHALAHVDDTLEHLRRVLTATS